MRLNSLKIISAIIKNSVKTAEDVVINNVQFCNIIKNFLLHKEVEIRVITGFIVRNLAVNQKNNIILLKYGYFDVLKFLILNDSSSDVIQSALLAICNLAIIEDKEIYDTLFNKGLILILEKSFECKRIKNIIGSLDLLKFVLSFYDKVSIYFDNIKEFNGR